MRLRLVVPPDVDTPTGGNVYDLAVAAALLDDGDEVDIVRCAPSALEAVLRRPWSGHTVVDGLLACPLPQIVAATRVGVLVHMPLGLQSGLEPDQATRLDELEGEALRAASQVIATSHWCVQYLAEQHGVHDAAVAPPGVVSASLSEGSDPPLITQLAALVPHKNQLGVVAALRAVQDLPWQARLTGAVDRDPDYATAVRDAVTDAGLSTRIDITGPMPRDEAWTGTDLALLPSLVESYGMVVTEALARGIPAVVSEGGPVEALGVTDEGEQPGVVIPAGQSDALARVLRRWLTDARHREDLRARALLRRHTLDGWETTARAIRLALTGS